jgi:hypothetical protein
MIRTIPWLAALTNKDAELSLKEFKGAAGNLKMPPARNAPRRIPYERGHGKSVL